MSRAGAWPPPPLVEALLRDLDGRRSDRALVLGSGLGPIAEELEDPWIRPAEAIEGYPRSTVAGHEGRLLLGRLAGRDVWVVQGRVHLYEGYTPEEATRYVRLLHALGVRTLVLTNAAGSVDREIAPGEIVLVSDAIGLFFRPLARRVGGDAPQQPWRRRDPLVDPALFRRVEALAREARIPIRTGILVGSSGPNYETAAEVRAWRRLGGTVASMSTLPEAVQARELGMRCVLLSLVTNFATGLSDRPLTHEEVVELGRAAGSGLARLLRSLVAGL